MTCAREWSTFVRALDRSPAEVILASYEQLAPVQITRL